jgi:hypothetical protein
LTEKLENNHLLRNDNWPIDMNSAYTLLNNWNGSTQFKSVGASDGVAFMNVNDMESGAEEEGTALVNDQGSRCRKD